MYRALTITMLGIIWKNIIPKDKIRNLCLIAVSTLIFMFDHINFTFPSFQITYINYWQQITVLIFGLFYGWLFIKYKSVYFPMLAHNVLNGVITILTLILYLIFRYNL